MELEQLSLLVGIGAVIGSLLIFVINVTLKVSKSMDSNTFAINQINETITRLWEKHDGIAEDVRGHDVRLAVVETRLDNHEDNHAKTD